MDRAVDKTMRKTTVLVVDDSALMRSLLQEILSGDPGIEVVGTASNAVQARQKIKELNPDVLTLDVEMPGMNGISFLERLMALRPMPVVMVSAMTQNGADTTMKALMLGAVDFVGKPRLKTPEAITSYSETVRRKVRAASHAKLPPVKKMVNPLERTQARNSSTAYRNSVIAIGASTGGVEAIYKLLAHLPTDLPPVLIAQHIPPIFSTSFARRLNERVNVNVSEARHGQALEYGNVYIAPGDRHLTLRRNGDRRTCHLAEGPKVNRHIPSVDVLFQSVAACEPDAVAILLTGMGDDGARGLRDLYELGANTIAQDESSSVVWGMPGAAVAMNAAKYILPLEKIADKVVTLLQAESDSDYKKERTSR